MATAVVIPKLGLTMEAGVVATWLKKEGDLVKRGEILFVLETDKITTDVECPESGTLLKILAAEGSEAKVMAPIAIIGAPGEDFSALLPGAAAPAPTPEVPASATPAPEAQPAEALPQPDRVRITPRAKALMADHGLGPEVFASSGKARISEDDVREYLARQPAKSPPALPARTPLRGMRAIIAQRLTRSKQTIPHAYFVVSVDATELTALRQRTAKAVSFHDLFLKAVAVTLRDFPDLNASVVDGGIEYHAEIAVGLAVALDDGLVVPVVRNPQAKSLGQIHAETDDLIQRARQGTLGPDDLQGGTFTITNLGMFPVDEFAAIINPPESAILAVGQLQHRTHVDAAMCIGVRPEIKLTLSVDHRIVDGVLAARFLQSLKARLEAPGALESD